MDFSSSNQNSSTLKNTILLEDENDLNIPREEKMKMESEKEIASELSKLQEELQNSRSRVAELEKEIQDLISLEDLISVLKEELQEISFKFQREARKRKTVEEHNLELQKLVQESHSNAEESIKKMNETKILLEISEFQVHELEEKLIMTERKLLDSLAAKNQNESRISEISSELEALHVKSFSLEMALQAANETEKDLVDALNRVNDEKRKLEDSVDESERKIFEAATVIENLKLELKSSMEKYHEKSNHHDLNHDGDGKMVDNFHHDQEIETREIATIKEVMVEESSNPLILPGDDDEKFYLEGMDGNPKIFLSPLEFYSEDLERENLELVVSLSISETHVSELQEALNGVLSQGNEISSNAQDQGENKHIQGGIAQVEETLNDDETLSLETDMNNRILKLEHQLFLYEREVESVRSLLREKEAALDFMSKEKNGVIEELIELQRELDIAFKKLDEKTNVPELERTDLRQAGVEASKLDNDGRNIRSIGPTHEGGNISEVPIEDPTIESSFRFILGVIVVSIILALIIGKRC